MKEPAPEAADNGGNRGLTPKGAAEAGALSDITHAMPDLSVLSKLKEKNLAAQGLMILEGRIVIEKALETGIVPRFLICTEAEAAYWRAKQAAADRAAAGEGSDAETAYYPTATTASGVDRTYEGPAFPIHVLSHAELCTLVDFKFHRGAIAVADMPRLETFAATRSAESSRQARYLCLWDVTDPSNLGALVRTAAGLGIDGVLLGPGCASPYYRKTIRASMGTVFNIPLWNIDKSGLAALAGDGIRVVAAALTEDSSPVRKFAATADFAVPLVLVLGNEGYGLPSEVLSICSDKVCIPMARGVDSLNVAVAGGILMYELQASVAR